MMDRVLTSLVALSLAFLVWLYARSRDQETIDNVAVPVDIVLSPTQADQFELEISNPCQVPVSFTGPPARIRELRHLLRRGELRVEIALTIPDDHLQESRYVEMVPVENADIHAPSGVAALVLEGRNRIPITVHRLVERRLPVRFDYATEDRATQIRLEPETVLVRGPQEVLDHVQTIPTKLCRLPRADRASPIAAAGIKAPLVQELEGRSIHRAPEAVTARFVIRPRQKTYELTDVPVQFLCPPHFALQPKFQQDSAGKISVRVKGPAADGPPRVVAYVDLTDPRRTFEPGLYREEPLHFQLPTDYQLVDETPPRSRAFDLLPVENKANGNLLEP